MRNSSKLKVEFNGPEHGWLTVMLSLTQQEYQFFPSHVPYDSISELVNALLKVVLGYSDTIVHWNDEPVEHEFGFSLEGERVHFRAYKISTSRTAHQVREEVFSFSGSPYQVVWPFWKALRDMKSHQSHEEYVKQWRAPFLEREMAELTEKLKLLKVSGTASEAA
jgi:hypothetical protein